MRCGLYSEKTKKKISFPAIIQLKADGMGMFVTVTEAGVICHTRSGESFTLDSLQDLKENPLLIDNIIQGEFLLEGITNRADANGKLNSLIKFKQGVNEALNPKEAKEIEDNIVFKAWDLIPLSEYNRPKDKKNKTPYHLRLSMLKKALQTNSEISNSQTS
jgi:hypothetical protein